MSRALRFVPIVLFGLVVAALIWRLANPADSAVQSTMIGQPVPHFDSEPALPGKPALASAELADGRAKLVNVFASWCVPCATEAPALAELKRMGVPIVGIAVRDRPQDLGRFLARHGDPFERIAADPRSRLQLALGSAGVPETFLVDGRGIVRMQHVGPIEPGEVAGIVEAVRRAR